MSTFNCIACWLLLFISLILATSRSVQATRTRLKPAEEPLSEQVYNNYRLLTGDVNRYNLEAARLLEDEHVLPYHLEDQQHQNGTYLRASFKFNATEWIRKITSIKWFVPLEERAALQVYDDQLDMDLAAGPQVNQRWCGLHLDYMLHRLEHHHSDIEHATDISLFEIMHSFDQPRLGISQGNNVFPGDYSNCKLNKLALIKQELAEVDPSNAEAYFSIPDHDNEATGEHSNIFSSILSILGPFVGIARPTQEAKLDARHNEQLRFIPMRYCFINMRWPSWPNSSFYNRNMAFRSAVCIPETCDSNSLSIHYSKIKQLADTQMSNFLRGYYIHQLYCLPDERSELRNPWNYTSTVLFTAFNLSWILLTLLATFLKRKREVSRQKSTHLSDNESIKHTTMDMRDFLNCWCLTKNIKNFIIAKRSRVEVLDYTNEEPRESRVNLEPLEGLKVISALSTITSHALMVILANTWNLKHGHWLLSRSPLAALNVICPSVVDIFFVVTGIITARSILKGPQQMILKVSFWISFFVYRYIRIVPLYLLVSWFLKSTFRFIGSGPFWDYGTSHTAHSKLCQDESWLSLILVLANFKSPSSTCNGVAWYLGNDLQFSLLTPIFMIIYLKRPYASLTIAAVATCAGIANHVMYYYRADTDIRGWFEWSLMILTRVTDDNIEGYVYPQYRFISYIIGLAAGQLLYEYEIGSIKRWPVALTTYGKKVIFFTIYLLCFIPYITSLVPLEDDKSIRWFAALLSGTLHGTTSIVAAMFVLLLCTNHMPWLTWSYSMQFLKPIANASLSTLLVHLPLLAYHSHTIRTLPELSLYSFVTTNFIWCVEAILLAMLVHIIYEMPLKRFLIKFLFVLIANNQEERTKSKDSKPNIVEKSKIN